jgi:hypothetical protein
VTEAIKKARLRFVGLFLYGPSTIFDQHAPVMPDEDTARLALRTAVAADFAEPSDGGNAGDG